MIITYILAGVGIALSTLSLVLTIVNIVKVKRKNKKKFVISYRNSAGTVRRINRPNGPPCVSPLMITPEMREEIKKIKTQENTNE